jgi:hypothetical protein
MVRSLNSVPALAKLLELDQLPASEAKIADYALLGEIDRKHPYLQGFSEARFADFTKVHFWRHRTLDIDNLEKARVLASFDSGEPAWFEVPVGKGSLLVMTSSWDREDSQLALSTKFIPLIYAILTQDPSGRDSKQAYFIGDSIPLDAGIEKTVTLPDGEEVGVAEDEASFDATDTPGLYKIAYPTRQFVAAVNVPTQESRLAAIEGDKLEQLLKVDEERAEGRAKGEIPPAKLSVQEQESQQKVWMWLLYLVMILLIVEILYSARCAQPKAAPSEGGV